MISLPPTSLPAYLTSSAASSPILCLIPLLYPATRYWRTSKLSPYILPDWRSWSPKVTSSWKPNNGPIELQAKVVARALWVPWIQKQTSKELSYWPLSVGGSHNGGRELRGAEFTHTIHLGPPGTPLPHYKWEWTYIVTLAWEAPQIHMERIDEWTNEWISTSEAPLSTWLTTLRVRGQNVFP